MIVNEIMGEAIAVDNDINLSEAAKIMTEKRTASIMYLNGKKVLGVITKDDLLNNFGKNLKISQIMNKNIIGVSPNSGLEKVGKIMKKNKLEMLPVIRAGKILGVVSIIDLVIALNKGGGEFVLD